MCPSSHIYLVAHVSFSSPHIDDVCYSDQVGSTVIARYHCGCVLVYYSPAACVLKLREEEVVRFIRTHIYYLHC